MMYWHVTNIMSTRWACYDSGIPSDAEDEDEEEASDDDSAAGPPPGFSSSMFPGFLNHMSQMSARRDTRPSENLSKNIKPVDYDPDEESSDDDDYGNHQDDAKSRCAACFRTDKPDNKWRHLVTLPCCGTNGREAKSSTRFCAACMLKLAVTRPHSSNTSEYRLYDDEPDEFPVRKFYKKSLQTDNRRFCECPRCRDILLVKIKGVKPALEDDDDEDSDDQCDCSDCEAERKEQNSDVKTAKSISVHRPSFKAKCWYIGRKRGVAKLLWKVSLLYHNFIPYEALGGDEEKATILKLIGWGILGKAAGKNNTTIYRIDQTHQAKLIKFFRNKNPSEKDQKTMSNMDQELGALVAYAAWRHLCDEYRLDRSLRLVNRLNFLALHFNDFLPPLPLSWCQEQVLTALVVVSVALILQFVCVLAVYAAAFGGVGISVCYMLRKSNNIQRNWWQIILISYCIYKLHNIFWRSPWLSWNVFISPKAMIPVKKMIWG